MMNADEFGEDYSYFRQSLRLIVFSYFLMLKDKSASPFSLAEIHQIIKKEKGRPKSKLVLEDYLRNDLTDNYLEKNRRQFQLEHFEIAAGREIIRNNVTVGIADIHFKHVSASEMNADACFIFECKRLNKKSPYQQNYVKEGVSRFVEGKYEAHAGAGILAFIEAKETGNKSHEPPVETIIEETCKTMAINKEWLKTVEPAAAFQLGGNDPKVAEFPHCYRSVHRSKKDSKKFDLHHLFLDFRDIITP